MLERKAVVLRVSLPQHEPVLHVHVEQPARCVVEPEVVLGRGVAPVGRRDQRFDPEPARDRAESRRVRRRDEQIDICLARKRRGEMFVALPRAEGDVCFTECPDKGKASARARPPNTREHEELPPVAEWFSPNLDPTLHAPKARRWRDPASDGDHVRRSREQRARERSGTVEGGGFLCQTH